MKHTQNKIFKRMNRGSVKLSQFMKFLDVHQNLADLRSLTDPTHEKHEGNCPQIAQDQ